MNEIHVHARAKLVLLPCTSPPVALATHECRGDRCLQPARKGLGPVPAAGAPGDGPYTETVARWPEAPAHDLTFGGDRRCSTRRIRTVPTSPWHFEAVAHENAQRHL